MTPKEKAQELLDKIINIANKHDCFGNEYPLAKDCALIAVDEILKEYAHAENHIEDIMGRISLYIKYWQEVKQEIEKL